MGHLGIERRYTEDILFITINFVLLYLFSSHVADVSVHETLPNHTIFPSSSARKVFKVLLDYNCHEGELKLYTACQLLKFPARIAKPK